MRPREPRTSAWRVTRTALLCVGLLVGTAARAEDGEGRRIRATTYYQLGMKLLKAGQCKPAIEEFRRAMSLVATAGSLFGIARCYEQLGQFEDAIGAYQSYLLVAREQAGETRRTRKAYGAIKALKKRVLGGLRVTCTPARAAVESSHLGDGECPFVHSAISPGPLSLRVSAPGYVAWEGTLVVSPGRELIKTIDLEPRPTHLSVRADVADGVAFVDDVELGRLPIDRAAVFPGPHTVSVRAPGREPWELELVLRPGQTVGLRAQLATAEGVLSVASTPPEAEVQIDGELVGKTPIEDRRVPAGKRQLRLSLPDYFDWTGTVEVGADSSEKTVVELLPAFGRLVASGMSEGAVVFVDGEVVGLLPLLPKPVRAGRHLITVQRSGFQPVSYPVDMPAGETLTLPVSLEPEPRDGGAGGGAPPLHE